MKITDWVAMLKHAKKSQRASHQIPKHTLFKHGDTHYTIRCEEQCSKCKHTHRQELDVYFKEPVLYMTTFEIGMLFMVVIQKRIPYEYSQWHKCIRGKRFIENIEVLRCAE